MKTERGMVENKESVFGYEVELERYGIFGGVEVCHDMTDINGRRGRYNEVESRLGNRHPRRSDKNLFDKLLRRLWEMI